MLLYESYERVGAGLHMGCDGIRCLFLPSVRLCTNLELLKC